MSKVTIGVSVGSQKFEMPSWMNIFQWACSKAKAGGEVSLQITCTLQRHTLSIFDHDLLHLRAKLYQNAEKNNLTLHESLQLEAQIKEKEISIQDKARKNGDEWITRNVLPYLNKMRKIARAFQVTLDENWYRWENWTSHSQYTKWRSEIETHHEINLDFRNAVLLSIEGAKERFKESYSNYPTEKTVGIKQKILSAIIDQYCYEYLCEETAVAMGVWQQYGYNLIVYPHSIIPILKEGRNLLVPKQLGGLLNWNKVARRIPKLPTENFLEMFLLQTDNNKNCVSIDHIPEQTMENLADKFLQVFTHFHQELQDMLDHHEIHALFLQQIAEFIQKNNFEKQEKLKIEQ